ncbi:hypothetical protein L1987_08176 [Smallanthus sonchifolius]|uniref:Uncharacterized protein n=1 Tax=Smallanthus sonchifolius TaxID=185202 RepID=A0ACB9JJE6_9ASTR|nr:hypothetical protein L1987_08176 [Smallanthus sonchifolius]
MNLPAKISRLHQSPILNQLFIAHLATDADMEDYGFEYSVEEPEEQDVDIENQYYNSKGIELFSAAVLKVIYPLLIK